MAHNLLINGVYWGYNPLILTFYWLPTGHPSTTTLNTSGKQRAVRSRLRCFNRVVLLGWPGTNPTSGCRYLGDWDISLHGVVKSIQSMQEKKSPHSWTIIMKRFPSRKTPLASLRHNFLAGFLFPKLRLPEDAPAGARQLRQPSGRPGTGWDEKTHRTWDFMAKMVVSN